MFFNVVLNVFFDCFMFLFFFEWVVSEKQGPRLQARGSRLSDLRP